MTGLSGTLPVLDQRLAKRLLAFERQDEAWPRGCTAIKRAEISPQREDLSRSLSACRGWWRANWLWTLLIFLHRT